MSEKLFSHNTGDGRAFVEMVACPAESSAQSEPTAPVETDDFTLTHGSLLQTKISNQESLGPAVWDVNLIDRMLYLVTPVIFLISSILLLFVVADIPPPAPSIECFFPYDQPDSVIAFARESCLRPGGTLYEPQFQSIPYHHDRPDLTTLDNYFPTKTYESPALYSRLVRMVVLSLVPFILWRIVGNVDVAQYMTANTNKQSASHTFSIAMFILTKLIGVGICALFIYLMAVISVETTLYSQAVQNYTKPAEKTVICKYEFMKLSSMHRYHVQCVVSVNENGTSARSTMVDYSNVPVQVIWSLRVWCIVLLVVQVINLLVMIAFLLVSQSKWNRLTMIQNLVGRMQNLQLREAMDNSIGFAGAFVGMLAIRGGYSQQVTYLYARMEEQLQILLNKRQ